MCGHPPIELLVYQAGSEARSGRPGVLWGVQSACIVVQNPQHFTEFLRTVSKGSFIIWRIAPLMWEARRLEPTPGVQPGMYWTIRRLVFKDSRVGIPELTEREKVEGRCNKAS